MLQTPWKTINFLQYHNLDIVFENDNISFNRMEKANFLYFEVGPLGKST